MDIKRVNHTGIPETSKPLTNNRSSDIQYEESRKVENLNGAASYLGMSQIRRRTTIAGAGDIETRIKSSIATNDDLKEIHKIDLEAFDGRYDISSDFDTYKEDLEDNEITTYALKDNSGKVIGYYQLEPVEDGELYIYSIAVSKNLRGTKASYMALKQMQKDITEIAKSKNLDKVILDVEAENQPLVKLYQRFGFKITDESRGTDAGKPYHDYRMEADVKEVLKEQELNETTEKIEIEEDKIKGNIDEETEVKQETIDSLTKLFIETDEFSDKDIEKIINKLPNEYCANVLLKYLEENKNNENIGSLRYLKKTDDAVKNFVSLLEDKDIESVPPMSAKFTHLDSETLKQLILNGLLNEDLVRNFDYNEISHILEQEEPVKTTLLKLYGSKLFSKVAYYNLYQLAKSKQLDIDFNKLSRIDAMSDTPSWNDQMSDFDAIDILSLSDEKLDIAEERNLFRRFPDRKNKLSGLDILTLVDTDDEIWNTIQERHLLSDIDGRNRPITSSTVIRLAKLPQTEWEKIQKRNILLIQETKSRYGHEYIDNTNEIIKLAQMTDEQFEKFQEYKSMTETVTKRARYGSFDEEEITRFDIDECINLACLPKEQADKIEKEDLINVRRNNQYLSSDEIIKLASLGGKRKELIDKYLAMKTDDKKDRFTPGEAERLADLSEEELKIAESRKLFEGYSSQRYSGKKSFFSAEEIINLIAAPEKTWQYLQDSKLQEFFTPYGFSSLSSITDEQWQRAFKSGILPAQDENFITEAEFQYIATLDDESWKKYTEDFFPNRNRLSLDLNTYSYNNDYDTIFSLEEEQYNRLKELMFIPRSKNYYSRPSFKSIVGLLNLDEKSWKRVKNDLYKINLLEPQLSTDYIPELAQLDDKKYERLTQIITQFQSLGKEFTLNCEDLSSVINCDDSKWETVSDKLNSGFINANIETLANIIELKDEERERLNSDEVSSLNISSDEKLKLVKLPEEKFKKAINMISNPLRKEKPIYFDTAKKILELSPENFDRIKDLLFIEDSNGYQIDVNAYDLDSFEKLTDEQIKRFKEDLLPIIQQTKKPILSDNINNIIKLLKLDDEQYKEVLENLKDINLNGKGSLGIYNFNVLDIAFLDKETYTKIKNDILYNDAFKNLFDYSMINSLLKLEPEQYNKLVHEIVPKYGKNFKIPYSREFKDHPMYQFLQLQEEDFNKVTTYLDENPENILTGNNINTLINLSEDEIKNLKEKTKNHPLNFDSMISLSKFSDKQYKYVMLAIEHFNKNINLLKHHDLDVTSEKLNNTLVNNAEGITNICDIIGIQSLYHGVGLRYRGLSQLLRNAESLTDLPDETLKLLKEKLNKLPHPEQKLAKLEIISAMVGNINNESILNIIDKIDSPNMTDKQKEDADRIFATDKPYDEQIEDFINEFNVPKEKQDTIRKFLKEQKLNTRYTSPAPIEEQIAVMDKKIESITRNEKVPADKKERYLHQLYSQKQDMIDNPNKYTIRRINDAAMKLLESQVEAHINLPNQNKEFTSAINKEIYHLINIEPTDNLLENLQYDSTYVSKLFGGITDSGFMDNFTKLIQLIQENPDKKLSDFIDTIPTNTETHKLFDENGLDYNRWIHFNPDSSKHFELKVDIKKAIISARDNLIKELNGPIAQKLNADEIAKLNKILENFDMDNLTQKDLPKIIKEILKELKTNPYWSQNDPNIKTFRDHIDICGKNAHDVEQLKDSTEELSVRLWDNDDIGRNIFFGNHVGCCTSVGSFNSFAAPQHLMNSFVNGIEMIDKSGKSMGNSMCYFAKIDNKLTFVIDSFEANGKLGAAPEVTDAIIEYAKQICEEMGRPDANIMFGPNYNKVNFERCIKTPDHTIVIIGRAPNPTYIDSIGGRGNINIISNNRPMHEIMDL